jgi:hypothetical protein
MTHPLTDKLCDQIVSSTPPLPRDQQDRILSYDGRILDGMFEEFFEEQKHQMRAAYDLGCAEGRDDILSRVTELLMNFVKQCDQTNTPL